MRISHGFWLWLQLVPNVKCAFSNVGDEESWKRWHATGSTHCVNSKATVNKTWVCVTLYVSLFFSHKQDSIMRQTQRDHGRYVCQTWFIIYFTTTTSPIINTFVFTTHASSSCNSILIVFWVCKENTRGFWLYFIVLWKCS